MLRHREERSDVAIQTFPWSERQDFSGLPRRPCGLLAMTARRWLIKSTRFSP